MSSPQEGYLVLANGSVLNGVVAVDGDHYRVSLDKGTLRIRADQVDFFCESMEEAYLRRKARTSSGKSSLDGHLEMARWCVQHELFSCAEREIQAARVLEPKNSLIDLVDRQLAQASDHAQHQIARSNHVIDDNQVKPAQATQEQEPAATGDIPPWVRTEFIKRIQPMVVHSCATGGCHSAATGQPMRIDRSALDGVGNPELIYRNLASVIAEVNVEDPETSPLLAMGAATHGAVGGKSKPLTPHQLEILRAWATQLTLREPPEDKEKNQDEPHVAQIVIGMNPTAQRSALATEQPSETSQDPFDPSAFNRKNAEPATHDAEPKETTSQQPTTNPEPAE